MSEIKPIHKNKTPTCNKCGGILLYTTGTKNVKCEYCNFVNIIKSSDKSISESQEEIDYFESIKLETEKIEKLNILTAKCNNCGAETTFDKDIFSSFCDFCNSPIIEENFHKSDINKPTGLFPFKIKKEECSIIANNWINTKAYIPKIVKNKITYPKNFTGYYMPFRIYDTFLTINYTGQKGKSNEITKTKYNYEGKKERIQKIKTNWGPKKNGTIFMDFNDLSVYAGNAEFKYLLNKIKYADFKKITPFDEKFLSGFKAELNSLSIKKGFEEIMKNKDYEIKSAVEKTIGGDNQFISKLETVYNKTSFKNILIPIWAATYKYKKNSYKIFINGQTKQCYGECPRILFKEILTSIIIIGIILLFLITLILSC